MGQARGAPGRAGLAALAGVLLLPLVLPLAGCSRGEPAAAPTETVPAVIEPDKTAPPSPEAPTPTPRDRWPLTGEPTTEVAERPALILKVENSRLARPQQGLEDADLVYEQVVEGGITRFAAVYDSHLPDIVYPVRSARGTDIGLVLPFGGVFGFSGANSTFLAQIQASGIQMLTYNAGDPGFGRVAGRTPPHDITATPATLLAQANNSCQVPPPAPQLFAADAAGASMATGDPATRISARMSSIQTTNWVWDQALGQYLRSDDATPSMTVAGTQMSATNVVLLSVEMFEIPGMTDVAGSPVPEVVLTGEGPAAFAAGGRYLEGSWSKFANNQPFEFLDAQGNVVEFAPGTTWYELVPTTMSWSIS